MKKFVLKILLYVSILIALVAVMLIGLLHKDYDGYLYEYNHKVQLLEETSQPRIIFVGGSNIAFSLDSKMLKDSLQYNVINFGLHAGLGIRYPFEDCLDYIMPGDIVVLQFEYENFDDDGNGDSNLLPLMISTDWRHCYRLNMHQWSNIIKQIPETTIFNFKRDIKSHFTHVKETNESSSEFRYSASGFNEYGDEISHLEFSSRPFTAKGVKQKNPQKKFLMWMKKTIKQYELAGAKVIILPPVCVKSFFYKCDIAPISKAMEEIGYPYVVEPSFMVLNDDCAFDTHYHMNREGRIRNTQNILYVLDSIISPHQSQP